MNRFVFPYKVPLIFPSRLIDAAEQEDEPEDEEKTGCSTRRNQPSMSISVETHACGTISLPTSGALICPVWGDLGFSLNWYGSDRAGLDGLYTVLGIHPQILFNEVVNPLNGASHDERGISIVKATRYGFPHRNIWPSEFVLF